MNNPKKKKGEPRPSKYPYLSEAYPYEYELGMKNAHDKAMNAFPTLSPEEQDMYGSADVFANYVLQGMDYPVQMVDNNRSEDFNLKRTGLVNLLAGVPGAMLTAASTNPYGGNIANVVNSISNSTVGKPYYQTGLYNKIDNAPEAAFVGGSMGSILAPIMVANKLNPSRYQIKGRDAIAPGLERMGDNALQNKGVGSFDHPFIPQADMSEYQYMPNAQDGAQVSGNMMMDQNQSVEDLFKNQMMSDIEKNYSSKNQIIKPFEQEMENGGMANQMPDEVAISRFKAAGKDKGLKGAELNIYVEKMKTKYGYQKGGSVYSSDVEDYYMPRFEQGGLIQYKGQSFPGYNKSINTPSGDKYKKMAMIKKGDKVKLVKYGLRKK